MHINNERAAIIKRSSLIALCGNALLAIAKITTGFFANSLAVIGDGIDTAVDVLIAAMTLMVSRIIALPADKEHPWGHGKAETIATLGLSFLLFFAGAQLIVNAVSALFAGEERAVPGAPALIVTAVSIAGKLLLALNQYLTGKKAQSAMLKANAQNMAADVATSGGVFIGLACSIYFNISAIDLIAAALVGIWVIRAAIKIFFGVIIELMDGCDCPEKYQAVFEAVHAVPGALNPHRTRIRSIAGFLDIDIDVEVNGSLTVHEAHKIATGVEEAIRARVENIFDVMVHIEPAGDTNNNEAYGLKEDSF